MYSHNCPMFKLIPLNLVVLILSPSFVRNIVNIFVHTFLFAKFHHEFRCWRKSTTKIEKMWKLQNTRIYILWYKSMQIGFKVKRNNCFLVNYEQNTYTIFECLQSRTTKWASRKVALHKMLAEFFFGFYPLLSLSATQPVKFQTVSAA